MISYAEKLKKALAGLAETESSFGIEDPRLIAQLDSLAEIYHSLGDFPSAEKYYLRSLTIKIQCSSESDPELINSFRKAGILYRIQGKFSEAEKFYKQTLNIVEKVYGSDSLEAARCFNYMTGLYNAQGNYQLAEQYLRKTLSLYEKNPSLEKFYLGSILFALALICQKQNKSGEAKHYKQLANDVLSAEIDGENSFVVAKQLISLAMIYFQKHDYEKTEILFRHAVIIEEESLWTYSPLVTDGLMTAAQLCAAMQRFKEAEMFYWMAKEKYEIAPNPNSDDLLNCLTHFATFYRFRQRYREEAVLLSKALEIVNSLDKNDLNFEMQSKKIAEDYAEALSKAAAMTSN